MDKKLMKEIVLEYLKSDLSKNEFKKTYKINTELLSASYDYFIQSIKSEEIYENEELKELRDVYENIMTMINYIDNGIRIDENTVREFDIVDYYQIKTIPTKRLNEFIKYLPTVDYMSIRKFMIDNKLSTNHPFTQPKYRLDINAIMREHSVVNCQINEEGIIIPETGRVVTQEDKLITISFMQEYNIPMDTYHYQRVLEKHLNNTLYHPNEKTLTKNINN